MGWLLPKGAPHAIQLACPTGFGVLQYSQITRLKRSDNSREALNDWETCSIVSQIFSVS